MRLPILVALALISTVAQAKDRPHKIPDFNAVFALASFHSHPADEAEDPPDPPDPPPDKAPRYRSDSQASVRAHLTRYCGRPGKDEYSWIRVKGKRLYCPS